METNKPWPLCVKNLTGFLLWWKNTLPEIEHWLGHNNATLNRHCRKKLPQVEKDKLQIGENVFAKNRTLAWIHGLHTVVTNLIGSAVVGKLFDIPSVRFLGINYKNSHQFTTTDHSFLGFRMTHINMLLFTLLLLYFSALVQGEGGFVTQQQLEVKAKLGMATLCFVLHMKVFQHKHHFYFAASSEVSVSAKSAIREPTTVSGNGNPRVERKSYRIGNFSWFASLWSWRYFVWLMFNSHCYTSWN